MHVLILSGSYYARPVNGHLGAPRPFPGSTASSSNNSSRNDSPSPTSSNDDSGIHGSGGPYSNGLSRPSKFTSATLPGAAKSSGAAGNPSISAIAASALPPVSPTAQSGGMICVGCKEPVSPGDVVVKAERAGRGKVWHPGCFKCDTCQVMLLSWGTNQILGRVFVSIYFGMV